MDTLIDTLYTGYGDQDPFNSGGVDQRILQNRGNEYLRYDGIHWVKVAHREGSSARGVGFPE